jgi:hypothetical protein
MKSLAALCFSILCIYRVDAVELTLPIQPNEAKIIQAIAVTEGVEVEPADLPAYAKKGLFETLTAFGLDAAKLKTAGMGVKGKSGTQLSFVYDAAGHVVALHGNGPWLRNSTLRSFKGLPELRSIRIDHNGFVGKDPRAVEYDGSGFDALADSKIADIKIGLGFSDKGMGQCAKIKALRSFTVAHSQTTEAGIAFFAGHPGLTSFSIGEMASSRVTEKALAAIAKIPNLTQVGFKECYVTYDGGFTHLAPLKGKLTAIDLTMSVASQADLAKLQADHPGAKILTIPPEEIVKRHSFIAANLAKQAPPELAAPLKAALEKAK